MADEILAKDASASLAAAIPTVIIMTTTHTVGMAPSGPFVAAAGSEVLLESDIDASFADYTTDYSTAIFIDPGTLKYQSLKSVSGMSELTKKNGDAIALKTTTGTITCSLVKPAKNPVPPTPVPDATPTYDIDFSFTDAGQTVAKSD